MKFCYPKRKGKNNRKNYFKLPTQSGGGIKLFFFKKIFGYFCKFLAFFNNRRTTLFTRLFSNNNNYYIMLFHHLWHENLDENHSFSTVILRIPRRMKQLVNDWIKNKTSKTKCNRKNRHFLKQNWKLLSLKAGIFRMT